jgi:hypothetical protein
LSEEIRDGERSFGALSEEIRDGERSFGALSEKFGTVGIRQKTTMAAQTVWCERY